MGESKVARVLQDFITTSEGEICLQKGDIVQILKETDKIWCYGCCNSRVGNMPLNYLVVLEIPDLRDEEALFASTASFRAQQKGDLSFDRGELIIGVRQVDENWWEGRIDNLRIGVFPRSYTWQLDSSLLKKRTNPSQVNMKALVKKSMRAQLEEEIDLCAGEVITIIEVIDKDWYRGVRNGQIGIFPSSFVTVLDSTECTQAINTQPSLLQDTSVQFSYSTNNMSHSDLDGLPSYNEVFGEATQPSSSNESVSVNDFDIFDDDYFRQNVPDSFFSVKQNRSLPEPNQIKELGIIPYGISLYPFHAQFNNELSFDEGEIVTLIRYVGRDWMEGRICERKGIFPCSYINIIVDCDQNNDIVNVNRKSFVDNTAVEPCSLETDSFARVLYSFEAQMNSDLSVKEGEVVLIVELPNESWCKVRNHAGHVGLCPHNYLTPHGMSNRVINMVGQRLSLANDNLLGSQKSLNDVSCETTDDKRNYQPHDFSVGSQAKVSVDDLICLNLDNLNSTSTWHPKPPTMSDHFGLGDRMSSCDLLHFDEVHNCSTSQKQVEETKLSASPIREVDWQNNGSVSSDRQKAISLPQPLPEDTTKGPLVPSRFAPPVPPPPLRRQMSDRMPHRPAPPVPLPGQKPVQRQLFPTDSIGCKSLIAEKEDHLQSLRQAKEEALLKMNSQNTDDPEEQVDQVKFLDEKIKVLTADLERLKAEEEETANKAASTSNAGAASSTQVPCSSNEDERRLHYLEQRQNVISELVMTEKEYVRDLKITYETFNLYNPTTLENRGINVKILFGNISEVMRFAEDFLDKLLLAMKGKNEDDQCIGIVFLEMAEPMKNVYGQYCTNHDNALSLLEKYDSAEEIQKIFNKGLETLRMQIACFDMGSILIKPVQRILKYPLILNELIKCTDDCHKDKPDLIIAVKTITDVATYINECKRRKDIVSKYLDDGNATISSRMSKLNLHSVAKKSSRLGSLVTSTLGFGAVTKDPVFSDYETAFHTVEKTIRTFLKNIESFIQHLREVVSSQCYIAEGFAHFYQEGHRDVEEFSRIQKLINCQYFKEFENTVQRRVVDPLIAVLDLFEGPAILIQKRHDKFLDYNACVAKAEKNKDIRLIQEEMTIAKNNYLALNDQLLEELPTLLSASGELFVECLSAFVTARKLFAGKVMKHYLAVLESSTMSTAADTVESCCVRYNLVLSQLCRLNFLVGKKILSNSPTLRPKHQSVQNVDEPRQESKEQTSSQRSYVQSHYNGSMLYQVIKPCVSSEPLELNLNPGDLIGVIKKQNPMGDTNVWFVDNGVTHGFVPSANLQEVYQNPAPVKHAFATLPSRKTTSAVSLDRTQSVRMSTGSLKDQCLPSYGQVVRSSEKTGGSSTTQAAAQESNISHRYEEVAEDYSSHYSEISEEETNMRDATAEFFFAMYDFQGDNVQTLSMKSGQVVKVLKKHDAQNNSEWWFAEDQHGRTGFIPANFVGKHRN